MVDLIETEAQLEDVLSTPGHADIEAAGRIPGDIMVLGAAGKMGPSLIRLLRRASDAAGVSRRIIAVSRFSSDSVRNDLKRAGAETVACDLSDPRQVEQLPLSENLLYLAGRKFGSSARPELTWVMNVLVPAAVAGHFRSSRIVAFSTGNVYPFVPPESGGSVESDNPGPVGEYAQSCLGRERIFEYFSRENGTKMLLYRLNYATDLRYGVLTDIARKVQDGLPVPLQVGFFNTLWQGDANSYALRCLELCASPPQILNVTGPERLSVRKVAEFFASRFRCRLSLEGEESAGALLSNASQCHKLLGFPSVSATQMMEWVAHWIGIGGSNLNKPTHWEAKNGQY